MDRKEPCRRRTAIAHSRLAMRELRLDATRERRHGLQVMTFEQLAARLAGGFSRPVDDDALREAIASVLPHTGLGELDRIKALPGMVNAAADTLRKAWRADIDLESRADEHPRLGSVGALEQAALDALPPAMKRPADLVSAGLGRLDRVPTLFGPIEIVGITELSLVWRPLLHAIAAVVNVRWIAGPRPVPPWLDGNCGRHSPDGTECTADHGRELCDRLSRSGGGDALGPGARLVRPRPAGRHRDRIRRSGGVRRPFPGASGETRTWNCTSCMGSASPRAGTGRRRPRSPTSCCGACLKRRCGG